MTQRNKSFLWIRRVIGVVFLIWGLPSSCRGWRCSRSLGYTD